LFGSRGISAAGEKNELLLILGGLTATGSRARTTTSRLAV